MSKTAYLRFVLLCICLFLCANIGTANKRIDTRKRTVDRFLRAWLVRKDIPAALQFFSSRALSNASVIDARCVRTAYISERDRLNRAAVKRGVSRFLFDGSHHIKGIALNEILFLKSDENSEQSEYLSGQLKNISFNKPETDRYYLASLASVRSLPNSKDDWAEFEKRYDLRNAFVSVLQYRVLNEDERYGDDIVGLFLWVQAKSKWQIVFAGVPCD